MAMKHVGGIQGSVQIDVAQARKDLTKLKKELQTLDNMQTQLLSARTSGKSVYGEIGKQLEAVKLEASKAKKELDSMLASKEALSAKGKEDSALQQQIKDQRAYLAEVRKNEAAVKKLHKEMKNVTDVASYDSQLDNKLLETTKKINELSATIKNSKGAKLDIDTATADDKINKTKKAIKEVAKEAVTLASTNLIDIKESDFTLEEKIKLASKASRELKEDLKQLKSDLAVVGKAFNDNLSVNELKTEMLEVEQAAAVCASKVADLKQVLKQVGDKRSISPLKTELAEANALMLEHELRAKSLGKAYDVALSGGNFKDYLNETRNAANNVKADIKALNDYVASEGNEVGYKLRHMSDEAKSNFLQIRGYFGSLENSLSNTKLFNAFDPLPKMRKDVEALISTLGGIDSVLDKLGTNPSMEVLDKQIEDVGLEYVQLMNKMVEAEVAIGFGNKLTPDVLRAKEAVEKLTPEINRVSQAYSFLIEMSRGTFTKAEVDMTKYSEMVKKQIDFYKDYASTLSETKPKQADDSIARLERDIAAAEKAMAALGAEYHKASNASAGQLQAQIKAVKQAQRMAIINGEISKEQAAQASSMDAYNNKLSKAVRNLRRMQETEALNPGKDKGAQSKALDLLLKKEQEQNQIIKDYFKALGTAKPFTEDDMYKALRMVDKEYNGLLKQADEEYRKRKGPIQISVDTNEATGKIDKLAKDINKAVTDKKVKVSADVSEHSKSEVESEIDKLIKDNTAKAKPVEIKAKVSSKDAKAEWDGIIDALEQYDNAFDIGTDETLRQQIGDVEFEKLREQAAAFNRTLDDVNEDLKVADIQASKVDMDNATESVNTLKNRLNDLNKKILSMNTNIGRLSKKLTVEVEYKDVSTDKWNKDKEAAFKDAKVNKSTEDVHYQDVDKLNKAKQDAYELAKTVKYVYGDINRASGVMVDGVWRFSDGMQKAVAPLGTIAYKSLEDVLAFTRNLDAQMEAAKEDIGQVRAEFAKLIYSIKTGLDFDATNIVPFVEGMENLHTYLEKNSYEVIRLTQAITPLNNNFTELNRMMVLLIINSRAFGSSFRQIGSHADYVKAQVNEMLFAYEAFAAKMRGLKQIQAPEMPKQLLLNAGVDWTVPGGSIDSLNRYKQNLKEVAKSVPPIQSGLEKIHAVSKKLKSSLAPVAAELRKGVNETRTYMANVERLNGSFKDMGRVVQGIIISQAFYRSLNMAQQALTGIADQHVKMEQMDVAFSSMLKSAEKGQAFSMMLKEFAAVTPFTFEQASQNARKFLAYGFQVQDIIPMMERVTDAASAMTDPDAFNRITRALGQIHTKGRLMQQEVNQLTEVGIDANKYLREELGLTQDQLAEIGKLQIPAEMAIEAILRGMEKSYAGTAEAMSKTAAGLMSTIKDNLALISTGLTRNLFGDYKTGLESVKNKLEEIRAIGNQMGSDGVLKYVFGDASETVRQFVANLQMIWGNVKFAAKAVAPLISEILRFGMVVVNLVTPALSILNRVVFGVINMITSATPVVRTFVYALGALMIATSVAGAIRALLLAIKSLAITQYIAKMVMTLAGAIKALSKVCMSSPWVALLTIAAGVLIYLAMQSDFAANMINKLSAAINGLFGKETSDVFDDTPWLDATDLAGSFAGAVGQGSEELDDLGDSAKKAGEKAKNALASFDEVFTLGTDDGMSGVDDLKDTWAPTFDPSALNAGIGKWTPKMPEVKLEPTMDSKFMEETKWYLGQVWDFWSSTLGLISGYVTDTFTLLAGTITTTAVALGGIFDASTTAMGNTLGQTKMLIGSFVYDTGKMFGEWKSSVDDVIVPWWNDTKTGFANWKNDTYNDLSKWWSDTKVGFSNWWSETGSGISTWWSDTKTGFATWKNNTFSDLSNWWSETKAGFSTWWSETKTKFSEWRSLTWADIYGWTVDTLSRFSTWVSESISGFGTWAADTAGKFTTWVSTTLSSITTWWTESKTKFSIWWSETKSGFAGWASETASKFGEWKSNTVTTVNTWWSETTGSLNSWWSSTKSNFSTWKNNVSSIFSTWKSETGSIISGWYTDCSNIIGGWIDSVVNRFTTWASDVKTIFSDVWDWIKNGFKNAGKWALEKFGIEVQAAEPAAAPNMARNISRTMQAINSDMATLSGINTSVPSARTFTQSPSQTAVKTSRVQAAHAAASSNPTSNSNVSASSIVEAVDRGVRAALASLPTPVNVGMLIADDRGIKEFDRRYQAVLSGERGRRG